MRSPVTEYVANRQQLSMWTTTPPRALTSRAGTTTNAGPREPWP